MGFKLHSIARLQPGLKRNLNPARHDEDQENVQMILWRAIVPHSLGSNCRSRTRNYNSGGKPNGSSVFRTMKGFNFNCPGLQPGVKRNLDPARHDEDQKDV